MSISDKVKFGSRSMATWLLFALSIFIIVYLLWIFFFEPSLNMGDVCMKNNDCKSKICYYEDGRHLRYCTERCSSDAECPQGWRCLHPPNMPVSMYVCIRR